MKKKILLFFSTALLLTGVMAQPAKKDPETPAKRYSRAVSAGIDLPFDDFSNSHSFGLGINYSWSHTHFGQLKKKPVKPLGILFSGGIDHYFGKKESYGYKFEGYTVIHGYGGLIFDTGKNGCISLTSGPVAAIYGGNTKAGFGITLNGGYYIKEKFQLPRGYSF